ncbi:glycosyltransferase family 4 protein [Corynebacterium imitans]|uniref:glycosyltransferase family 4 protein n=2 Tax=Corynebacterium imitans TaxID=156978 RepID=UPI0030B8617E
MRWLRQLSLMGTVALWMLIENPSQFSERLSTWLRVNHPSQFSKLVSTACNSTHRHRSGIEQLIYEGEFSAAVARYQQNPSRARRDISKVKTAAGEISRLRTPIARSPEVQNRRTNARPLFYLTNSLPHTVSGYTLRSQASLEALRDQGIKVNAITRLGYPNVIGKFATSEDEEVGEINYHRQMPLTMPRTLHNRDEKAVSLLVKQSERWGATLLHTTSDYRNALVAGQAAKELGVPWVYEVRGEPHKTWLSKRIAESQSRAARSEFFRLASRKEIEAMNAASAVVVLSEISRQRIREAGIPDEKIYVVPNAVDETLFYKTFNKQSLRRELGIPNGKVVGIISSLVDYEGVDTLLESIHIDSTLNAIIVGEGEARPHLESVCRELSIEDRVQFVGKKPPSEIWKWYASLDVMAIPRRDEEVCRTVTPIKGLAAQALGVPVVASDLPALREITGGHAVYFQPESAEGLVDGIGKALLQDSKQLEQARGWARSHTWHENAKKYVQIYDAILG